MDEAGHDALACMTCPELHSTNPIERLHGEIKRRTHVVGIFSNEGAITRLVGAALLEPNDEGAVSGRFVTLESIPRTGENLTLELPAVAPRASRPDPPDTAMDATLLHHGPGHDRNRWREAGKTHGGARQREARPG